MPAPGRGAAPRPRTARPAMALGETEPALGEERVPLERFGERDGLAAARLALRQIADVAGSADLPEQAERVRLVAALFLPRQSERAVRAAVRPGAARRGTLPRGARGTSGGRPCGRSSPRAARIPPGARCPPPIATPGIRWAKRQPRRARAPAPPTVARVSRAAGAALPMARRDCPEAGAAGRAHGGRRTIAATLALGPVAPARVRVRRARV
jgi:hypothetical protein